MNIIHVNIFKTTAQGNGKTDMGGERSDDLGDRALPYDRE